MDTENLLKIIRHRRSVRVYKTGKVSHQQLENILEARAGRPPRQHPALGVRRHSRPQEDEESA